MARLNPEEIKFWIKEAESCILRQKLEMIQKNNYPFLVKYFEGRERFNPMHEDLATDEMAAIINEFFPNTNALISEIMYQNPDIVAEASNPMAEEGQSLMKGALTYGFDKADALTENRVALFDMLYAGYSAVEVDHIVEEPGSMLLPDDQLNRKNVVKRIGNVFKKVSDIEEAEKKLEAEKPKEEKAFATVEDTYVRRWDPLNVPLDWRARRLKERRYNLKKVFMSKAEFDVKYPNFKDKVSVTEQRFVHSKHLDHKHMKKVLLYEFQIKKKNNDFWTLIIAPSWPQEEMDFFKRLYSTNGFNMKIGTLHKYGMLYPISFAQVNKKMQDELNHYVKFIMETAERNVPKYVVGTDVGVEGTDALRSKNVNDIVKLKSAIVQGRIEPLKPTIVARENKELLQVFQDQKEKLWSVSTSRLTGRSEAKFATELDIQEAGFEARQIDIQEGLRQLIREELDTFKDIIATFWDKPFFFKVTGGEKPTWYEPNLVPDPNNPGKFIVENPLSELLTADYMIRVDIQTALRPNLQREKNDLVLLLREMISPPMQLVLQQQGRQLNTEFIDKIVKKFGLTPETFFTELQQPTVPPEETPT